jgi:hypothetical protein
VGNSDEHPWGHSVSGITAAQGYTDFYVGAPLGPDLAEAADLLADRVVPALWPERPPR